jgi:predicted methyltransferase MtxX (methanogen marker protein 4)
MEKISDLFNGVWPVSDRSHIPVVAAPDPRSVNGDDVSAVLSGGRVDNFGV